MSFDSQPVLKGELVELRPLRSEDFDELYAVASDPLIWEQHPARNRHEEAVFRQFFREALASGGALVAIDAQTRHVIGSSRFHGYDAETSELEIGWTFLARSHWGGRYNGEMKRLMMEHAFRFVDSILFFIGLENMRSQRAVEKIGGVRVGTRPDSSGEERCVYQLRREDLGRKHQFHGVQPVLPVHDVARSADYFCSVLGFELDFLEGEPPIHGRIRKGDGSWGQPVYIHLTEASPAEARPSGELRIYVGHDIDGLFEAYQALKVEVVFAPVSQPWGLREFAVRELNGHVLRFCAEL